MKKVKVVQFNVSEEFLLSVSDEISDKDDLIWILDDKGRLWILDDKGRFWYRANYDWHRMEIPNDPGDADASERVLRAAGLQALSPGTFGSHHQCAKRAPRAKNDWPCAG